MSGSEIAEKQPGKEQGETRMWGKHIGMAAWFCVAATGAYASDLDEDGLDDDWELKLFGSIEAEQADGDPDLDGLDNLEEQERGTHPLLVDTDDDFLTDGEEILVDTDPTLADTDGDGLSDHAEVEVHGTNPRSVDTDGGGIWDGQEVYIDRSEPLTPFDDALDQDEDGIVFYFEFLLGTDDLKRDSDGDGLEDGEEDWNLNGLVELDVNGNGFYDFLLYEETDPALMDTDGDGMRDGWEVYRYGTDPYRVDSDDDGLTEGDELILASSGLSCMDPAEPDSDFDGLLDGDEVSGSTSPCMPDTDGDGVYDAVELADGTRPDDEEDSLQDQDGDGLSDRYETEVTGTNITDMDTDGDGIDDGQEVFGLADRFVTHPQDADSDDDGLLDGNEGGIWTREGTVGGTDPTTMDTDGDHLTDGVELGLTTPEVSIKDTDATELGRFQADADPETRTHPLLADSDWDKLADGFEDANGNGRQDIGETRPDQLDTDWDGIDDGWEVYYSDVSLCHSDALVGMDPLDGSDAGKDLDDDALTSLEEYLIVKTEDGEEVPNSTNPCQPDTDEDGLNDDIEVKGSYGGGRGTDPNLPDTDEDGVLDGVEDANADGWLADGVETDPTMVDTDGDGLSDGREDADGDGIVHFDETDPLDVDSDKDGLTDGQEVLVLGTDPRDVDTDDDGLSDGLEVGVLGDNDPASRTSPVLDDTDGDGIEDGTEDANRNGQMDEGETHPLDFDTDDDGLSDGEEDLDADGRFEPDRGETDPRLEDTDGGGVADGLERQRDGTDPNDPLDDVTADPDGDGLNNAEERLVGSDPLNPDTDGDAISDGDEILWTLPRSETLANPLDSDADGVADVFDTDSDNDGLSDRQEAGDGLLETPPRNTDGDENPDYRDLDSDNGGVDDQIELSLHESNPYDASDDGVGWLEGPVSGGPGCQSLDRGPLGYGWLLLLAPLVALRSRGSKGVALLALMSTTVAHGADHPDARTTWIDANPYRLDLSGQGILSTESGRVLGHGLSYWGFGFQTLSSPLVIRDGEGQILRHLVSSRQQLDISGAIGLFDRLELGLSLPVVVNQNAELPGYKLGSVSRAGVGDWVLRPKFQWLKQERNGVNLSLSAPVALPTGNRGAYMSTGRVSVEPTVALSRDQQRWSFAGAFGVKLQRKTTLGDLVDHHKLTGRLGFQWRPVSPKWSVSTEVVGAVRATAPFANKDENWGEWVTGSDIQVRPSWYLTSAFGVGIATGQPTASWRGVVALSWRPVRRPDLDQDGIRGRKDLCPDLAEDVDGFKDEDGCPDLDNDEDGVSDIADSCVDQPEDQDGFEDEDGCPDTDNDQDGFLDSEDACPDVAEDVDEFEDEDGCPEHDNDDDGFADVGDECPNDPEDFDTFEDEDGCPEEGSGEPMVEVTDTHIELNQRILFEQNTPKLRNESHTVLDEVARTLIDFPQLSVIVEGHTDSRGREAYNLKLSQARAAAVVYYLQSALRETEGVPPKLSAVGLGESHPVDSNRTSKGRANNRRVVFRIDGASN